MKYSAGRPGNQDGLIVVFCPAANKSADLPNLHLSLKQVVDDKGLEEKNAEQHNQW